MSFAFASSTTKPDGARIIVSKEEKYLINLQSKTNLDIPLSPLDSSLNRLLLSLRWLAYGSYVKARYTQILDLNDWISWSTIILEVCATLPALLLQLGMSLGLFAEKEPRRSYELVGNHVPRVSILITCCGEDPELAMDCLRAASSQDYPCDRYHIFVLDDAANAEMKEMVQTYSNEHSNGPGVTYLARKKIVGVPHYYKAGNLRFGFDESAKLFDSPYVTSLDVDSVVDRLWLRKALPHLLLDSELELINVRNRNYNLPTGDPLRQATQSVNSWGMSIMDATGTIGCYGSAYIVRRAVVDEIGGWPKVNVGEDLMLAFTLSGNGKHLGICADVLQQDLTPESIDSIIVQRERWIDGDLNLLRHFRFFIPGLDPAKHRTVIQTISGILMATRVYTVVTDMAVLALMPLVTYIAASRTATAVEDSTNLTIHKTYLASILIDKISTLIVFGLRSGQIAVCQWLIWYRFKRLTLFYLPWTKLIFKTTGATPSLYNERSRTGRSSLTARSLSKYCLPFLCYSSLTAYVLFSCIHRLKSSEKATTGTASATRPASQQYYCTASLVWLLEICVEMSRPWRYMLWPPDMPDRKILLKHALKDNDINNNNDCAVEEKEKPVIDKSENTSESKQLLYNKIHAVPWLDVLQLGIVFLLDWSYVLFGW